MGSTPDASNPTPSPRPRLGIFGSCVSRDPFSFTGDTRWDFRPYVARNSAAGLYDPPLDFEPAWFASLPVFEQRCLATDFGKTAPGQLLRRPAPKFLILDFIDERFDLAVVGETRLSRTGHLRGAAGFAERYGASATILPRLSDAATALWSTGISRFLDAARRHVPARSIILHEARWAPRFRAADGTPSEFNETYRGLIDRHNRLLDEYHAVARAALPEMTVLRVDDAFVFADPAHRWSKEPFHYVPEYYREFVRLFDLVTAAATG
jgi:hypothetical protein